MKLDALHPDLYQSDRTGELLPRLLIEQKLDVQLPDILCAALEPFDGPIIFDVLVGVTSLSKIPNLDDEKLLEIELLYGLNDGEYGIIGMKELFRSRVDKKYLPIADPGAGDQIFLNVQSGEVFFWHHECSEGERSPKAVTLISKTIEAFLSGLVEIPETDEESKSSGVIYKPGQAEAFRELDEKMKRGEKLPWQ